LPLLLWRRIPHPNPLQRRGSNIIQEVFAPSPLEKAGMRSNGFSTFNISNQLSVMSYPFSSGEGWDEVVTDFPPSKVQINYQ
jgi:hypothetical protein